jgi:hypothetical protein
LFPGRVVDKENGKEKEEREEEQEKEKIER